MAKNNFIVIMVNSQAYLYIIFPLKHLKNFTSKFYFIVFIIIRPSGKVIICNSRFVSLCLFFCSSSSGGRCCFLSRFLFGYNSICFNLASFGFSCLKSFKWLLCPGLYLRQMKILTLQARSTRGVSLRAPAAKTGISKPALYRMENEKPRPETG